MVFARSREFMTKADELSSTTHTHTYTFAAIVRQRGDEIGICIPNRFVYHFLLFLCIPLVAVFVSSLWNKYGYIYCHSLELESATAAAAAVSIHFYDLPWSACSLLCYWEINIFSLFLTSLVWNAAKCCNTIETRLHQSTLVLSFVFIDRRQTSSTHKNYRIEQIEDWAHHLIWLLDSLFLAGRLTTMMFLLSSDYLFLA